MHEEECQKLWPSCSVGEFRTATRGRKARGACESAGSRRRLAPRVWVGTGMETPQVVGGKKKGAEVV